MLCIYWCPYLLKVVTTLVLVVIGTRNSGLTWQGLGEALEEHRQEPSELNLKPTGIPREPTETILWLLKITFRDPFEALLRFWEQEAGIQNSVPLLLGPSRP